MMTTLDMKLNESTPHHQLWRDAAGDGTANAEARAQLQAHPYRSLSCVQCQCRARQLTLSGIVESYYLKQLAQVAVAAIEGVESIHNRIEVRPTTAAGQP